MEPVLKLWLYQHWLGDQRDNAELAKNHAYLLGSFSNPEAVQKMMNDNVHESSDEDMDESLRMVSEIQDLDIILKPEQAAIKNEKSKPARKRKRATLQTQ